MSKVRWDPALSVGDPVIDAQHEELFRRVDGLLGAMAGGDRAEISRLFEFLEGYVVEHFAAEERLMAESAFPGATVHRAAHERFVRDYRALRQLFEQHGPSAALGVKTRLWLVDWLRSHIASIDQQMVRHVLRRSA